MTARKPVRVRKARAQGTCPLCIAPILVGQQIAAASLIRWAHVMCVIEARMAQQAPGGAT
jgi:hypothetical protein